MRAKSKRASRRKRRQQPSPPREFDSTNNSDRGRALWASDESSEAPSRKNSVPPALRLHIQQDVSPHQINPDYFPPWRRWVIPSAAEPSPPAPIPPFSDPRYETFLAVRCNTHLREAPSGISLNCRMLLEQLLSNCHNSSINTQEGEAALHRFFNDRFCITVQQVANKNKEKLFLDIGCLLVPPVERTYIPANTPSYRTVARLTESVMDSWSNIIPLVPGAAPPRPDYAVGFRREAFTRFQLANLSRFLGNFPAGDQSIFLATYYMCFPFLVCHVAGPDEALDTADRRGAAAAAVSMRAVTELYSLLGMTRLIDRQILAWSVSFDHSTVRVYAHYPVLREGFDPRYHRKLVMSMVYTAAGGDGGEDEEGSEERFWRTYWFIKAVYEEWSQKQYERIAWALDHIGVATVPEEGGSDML